MAMVITIIGIMNITLINQRRLIPEWWCILLAIVLLVFALPPFVARSVTVWDEETRSAFLSGKEISEGQARNYISGRESVVGWFPYSVFLNDLSMIALDHVTKDPNHAQAYLDNAFYWQKKALRVAPADPYGWFRLAFIQERLGQKDKAAEAWLQSYMSAPYEPRLLLSRLGMAQRLHNNLGDDAPALILQLIRQAWAYNPWHLTRMARDNQFIALAKEALMYDTAALARLDKILKEQL